VQEGHVIAAERPALVTAADALGLFVLGLPDPAVGTEPSGCSSPSPSIKPLGAVKPGRGARGDCVRASAVLHSLAAFKTGCAVVVARDHVLAVETGEGIAPMLERASGLRQWGGKRWGRRAGIVLVRYGTEFDGTIVEAARKSGLEGIGILVCDRPISVHREVIAAADRAGLALLEVRSSAGVQK
jgi:DUF1009 family protein